MYVLFYGNALCGSSGKAAEKKEANGRAQKKSVTVDYALNKQIINGTLGGEGRTAPHRLYNPS